MLRFCINLPVEPLYWALNLYLCAPEDSGLTTNLQCYFLLGRVLLHIRVVGGGYMWPVRLQDTGSCVAGFLVRWFTGRALGRRAQYQMV